MNARMLLMGASLRPWLAPLPSWQVYPMLHLTTDPGWLIAMRYRAEGGNDAAVFLGGGADHLRDVDGGDVGGLSARRADRRIRARSVSIS